MVVYRLAGLGVALCPLFPFTENALSPWRDDNIAVDMTVTVTKDDLKAEAARCPTATAGMLEMTAILRALAGQLPHHNGLFLHAASVLYDGKAYAFTAPSGTGKSTHISLWMKLFGDKVSVINGDKPIVRILEDRAVVYSCPWAGKEGWKNNISASLGGICLLRRGKENKIIKISPSEYFDELMRQVYIPKNSEAMLKTLELIDALAKIVPFYLLECDISDDAARTSFEAMVK